jgi:hypothetical protein
MPSSEASPASRSLFRSCSTRSLPCRPGLAPCSAAWQSTLMKKSSSSFATNPHRPLTTEYGLPPLSSITRACAQIFPTCAPSRSWEKRSRAGKFFRLTRPISKKLQSTPATSSSQMTLESARFPEPAGTRNQPLSKPSDPPARRKLSESQRSLAERNQAADPADISLSRVSLNPALSGRFISTMIGARCSIRDKRRNVKPRRDIQRVGRKGLA